MFKHRQWPELSDKITHWPEFLHGFEVQKFFTSLVSLADISQKEPVKPLRQMQNNWLSVVEKRHWPPFLQILTFFGHSNRIAGFVVVIVVVVNGKTEHVGPYNE